MRFRLALVGFARVAQGLAKILVEKRAHLRRQLDFGCKVMAVADTFNGSVMSQSGPRLDSILMKGCVFHMCRGAHDEGLDA
jgi:homoserine dehydrogenase